MMDFETVTRFPPNAVAFKLAIALAVGMLVGFERHRSPGGHGRRLPPAADRQEG